MRAYPNLVDDDIESFMTQEQLDDWRQVPKQSKRMWIQLSARTRGESPAWSYTSFLRRKSKDD